MYRFLKSSSLVKNLSILVSGTVLAQFIVIAFQVVLRRIYAPADFGAFAVYMSLVGIAITIATLRYEQTIVLPKENDKAVVLLKTTFFLAAVFSLLLFAFVAVFKLKIIRWLDFPNQYAFWLYFLPLSILVFSIAQALNYYLIRIKAFKLSALNKTYRRSGEGVFQSVFGFLGQTIGLLFGDIIGRIITIFWGGYKIRSHLTTKLTAQAMVAAAKEYKDFPLKNGIPALLNTLSALLPIIFINRLFSAEETGYFDLARMVLIVPLSLITASLSQVLLQSLSEKRNQNKSVKKQVLGTLLSLTFTALIFGFVIQFFGEELFKFVFGQKNEMAGTYAKIIVWAYALKFVISPFNMVFTVFKSIGVLSLWQLIYFGLILLLIFFPYEDITAYLSTYLLIELVSYGLVAVLSIAIVFKYEKSLQ